MSGLLTKKLPSEVARRLKSLGWAAWCQAGKPLPLFLLEWDPDLLSPLLPPIPLSVINAPNDEAGGTALMEAAWHHPKWVEVLLGKGADVHTADVRGMTALHIAAMHHASVVPALLSAGASPNVATSRGFTALGYACRDQPDAIWPLLEAGANVDMATKTGHTPLMFASGFSPHAVSLLLERGARVTAHNNEKMTVLHFACATRVGAAAILPLLESGALIDEIDGTGSTPLVQACKTGAPDSVRVLVAMGADLALKNTAGHGPLMVAALSDHPECMLAILDHAAPSLVEDFQGELLKYKLPAGADSCWAGWQQHRRLSKAVSTVPMAAIRSARSRM